MSEDIPLWKLKQRAREYLAKCDADRAGRVGKMTREEVVQAALTVERWCIVQSESISPKGFCDCPFDSDGFCRVGMPKIWALEKFLRERGLKDDD